MRAFLQKTIYALMIAAGVSLFVLGFLAYMIRKVDVQAEKIYDGLGRELTEPPIFAQLIFTDGSAWPGWAWFFGDCAIFWGTILIIYMLANLAGHLKTQK